MDVVAQGNICNEPELSYSKDGIAFCNFRVAITMGKSIDQKTYETRFFNVVCFRSLAENVAASLAKGDRVSVVGTLKMQKWTSKDGKEGDSMKIEANDVSPNLTYATAVVSRTPKDGEKPAPTGPAPADVDMENLPF